MEVFNRKTEFGGSFRGDELIINFAGFNAGYLINQVSANYNAPITRIRELGSKRTYFVSGDGFGSLQIGRVTGPASSISSLLRAYSDVCSVAQNVLTMSFAAGKCTALAESENGLTFEGVLFQQWNLNASSQGQSLITTSVSGTYENLEDDDLDGDLSDALNQASNIAASLGQ
jgi:hypothetical protein